MAQFPTAEALASATEADALAAWEGLGYYRRLRNLRAAAGVIAEFGWPSDLRCLPGVGSYTAAAVHSIAFGGEDVCVDGNVRRVWSRFFAKDCGVLDAGRHSTALMAQHHAGEWNQAVMELGAVLCKPRQPACLDCPISFGCASFKLGCAEKLPATKPKRQIDLVEVYACAIRGDRVGVRKCQPGEWWEGMYTFPRARLEAQVSARETAVRLGLHEPTYLGRHNHTVTCHRISLQAFVGKPSRRLTVEWKRIHELDQLPMPSPARRVVAWLECAL